MTNSANNVDVLKWYFENEKNLTILAKGQKNPIRRFLNRNNRNFCQKTIDRGSLTSIDMENVK